MLVLLFYKLPEQYSQTNFPIVKKKKAFYDNKIWNKWQIFRPKWAK